MCGIVAYSGSAAAGPHLVEALGRLEYRGYDSAGIAVRTDDHEIAALRTAFRVDDLTHRLAGWPARHSTIGIGHTRWATHGEVSLRNAHPHLDCSGRIAVVHNGVLENATELRVRMAASGHTATSDTDTEVIAHLIEAELLGESSAADLPTAVQQALGQLRGSWALVALDAQTGELVAACQGSPMVVAETPTGVFAASDVGAIAPWIDRYHIVEDGDLVELRSGLPWRHGTMPMDPPDPIVCTVAAAELSLGMYPDFMAKEIEQQPEVAAELIASWTPAILDGLWPSLNLAVPEQLTVVACGTSLNAGKVIAQAASRLGALPFTAIEASELGATVTTQGSLAVVLSQSGETADVLRALEELHARGHQVLALTNNPDSALARRAEAVMLCQAGPEIGVAATKTFVAQVVGGTAVLLSMLGHTGKVDELSSQRLVRELDRLPEALAQAIGASRRVVPSLVQRFTDASGFIFLGRGPGRVLADEGALKLKELTYRWAESHAAGELKHGPLALVESGTPVLVIDDGTARTMSTIAEVRARGGHVITIGTHEADIAAIADDDPHSAVRGVPWLGPVESVVALQVFARELAIALGRDVDKPRNLAKSVTVE